MSLEKINTAACNELLATASPLLLEFSSPGCAPCRKSSQVIAELRAESDQPGFSAYVVDITEEPELAQRFMVFSVPTTILFMQGLEKTRISGVPNKDKLRALLT